MDPDVQAGATARRASAAKRRRFFISDRPVE